MPAHHHHHHHGESPAAAREPWLTDPLALASGAGSRLVLALALLAVLWGGVMWALAA